MLYKGVLISAASGRLDSVVFSRNRGGPYIRAWVQPDETATTERQAVWDAMTNVNTAWQALSDSQRAAWARYSKGIRRPNRIGSYRSIGGYQEYTRANFTQAQANELLGSTFASVDNPPADPGTQPSQPPAFSCVFTGGAFRLRVSVPAGAGWSSDPEAGIALYTSPGKSTLWHQWPGPYTLAGVITSPGTSGTTDTLLPDVPTSGQVVFVRWRAFDGVGHLGARQHVRVPVP